MSSEGADGKKKRKTKLEKIYELETALKLSKEENRRLKKDLSKQKAKSGDASDGGSSSIRDLGLSDANDGNEKLKEAVRALKRVAVKQEMSLKTLRTKAHQRRKEIEQRDNILSLLKEEVKSLKKAYEKFTAPGNDDVSMLRARVAELELKLATEDSKNEAQNKKLAESNQNITSLKDQLHKMRGKPQRVPSSKSLKSTESGASVEDVMKLKRDLATKMEKIAALEYDLDEARDEIHELKQKTTFDASFPVAPGHASSSNEDWFSDNEEDDFWG
uniref:Uncharacterized protein n=1 Tax=Craspedostauros australis TaxID=1486917 RepID=A0A7R9WTC6_9STRA|mmetsp:Transcript_19975/g.55561  ORF Transcript_19975/g.55561 Transcript_19975/m.55561 type:complete len:274 (+) Transcript_19975:405-1226(+)|eukprot:CAMPEP_0198113340 /NCGR_PEP_ID=MMETSP1442-20131203/5035_1 /TAXON_ID= /ORGANISM="Craspedostauros australis, Strain CCMP3328" /LENGTH=273 /DNA_ID=CAMNT_0043770403 /DNA_START=371 /DNA_END=1192 /DNA_ORIENTATION=-